MIGIAEWTVNPTTWVGWEGLVDVGVGRREKRESLPANRCADAPWASRSRFFNACANRGKLDGSFARPIGALRGMQ